MKRLALLAITGLIFGGCGPSHMIKQDTPLNVTTVKPKAGKAAMVVSRTTSFGGAIEFDTFLDKKMFGVTKGTSCFVKDDIEPGSHYVASKSENLDSLIINFDPDKVYYLHQDVRMGIWKARVKSGLTSMQQVAKDTDNDCPYYVYNLEKPGPDLDDADWQEVQKNARTPLN